MFSGLKKNIKKSLQRKIDRYQRKKVRRTEKLERKLFYEKAISDLFSDLTVKHGIFKGLKYPGRDTVCSVYIPKLIGSYEKEIQPALESACTLGPRNIINIGCAEGYYAVGLAKKNPQATVYAFDIDDGARSLCQKMAEFNGVRDRVILAGKCDSSTLMALPLDKKTLIVCDCEGYELDLFSEELAPSLAKCSILVEIHDVIDITISSVLKNRFSATHNIQVIESIDDIKKARLYQYPELEDYPLAQKKLLFAEYRGAIMEWFYMTPLER